MSNTKKTENEILAVIGAAISVISRRDGIKYKIKTCRRLQNTNNMWSNTGKIERLNSRL
jgi:hypothetical protein